MFERPDWKITLRAFLATFLIGGIALVDIEGVRANNSQSASTNRGWPTRRVGGGSRTGCSPDARPCSSLMALIPDGLLRTSKRAPTLLFYLPSIANPRNVQFEFVLRDENDRLVYEKIFTSNGEEGILEFSIDPSEIFAGLESGRSYHWYLSIIRDRGDRARDEVVEGWIERVPLQTAVARQLEGLSPIERVKWYESENLWTEALSELAVLKRSRPEDGQVALLWKETIASLDLPLALAISPKHPLEISRSLPVEEIR